MYVRIEPRFGGRAATSKAFSIVGSILTWWEPIYIFVSTYELVRAKEIYHL